MREGSRTGLRRWGASGVAVLGTLGLIVVAVAAPTVPTEVQMPGTQPLEAPAYDLVSPSNCAGCHAGTPNPEFEPSTGWQGSMMAHSARDPLFWAALAVAEQSFLPGPDPETRGGVGDFCLRCHLPNGWLQGRSTATDGSAMQASTDANGVECMHCHALVDPDPPVNIEGTTEAQFAPFMANDGEIAWHGSGMYVVNPSTTVRLGPYNFGIQPVPHSWEASNFHRESDLCGTCHDVSNPVVGDLAHNNGAQQPLAPGQSSGVLGAPVEGKAAFNNPPHAYGVVERTYSEWKASALETTRVNDFATLPAPLQTVGGSLEVAYSRAWRPADTTADYVDGTPRYFTCQTCHMSASTGKGCKAGSAPVRTDLPRHDLTGSGYWVPDAILWQHDNGTLRFGNGLTAAQRTAMAAGQERARQMLQSAALLEGTAVGPNLEVRVTNLTGHKLITGYPEGRRMWLNVRWYDGPGGTGNLVHEDGGYGNLGVSVQDLDGDPCNVSSLLEPEATIRFDVEPGIDQQWAEQLLGLGLDPATALSYDRLTGAVEETLGELATQPSGARHGTFHFSLNNVVLHDTRIPPYGFDRDEALERNALPVPANRFGAPGPGGTYEHWNLSRLAVPPGAVSAVARLYYQQTSWEYVQFLALHNDEQNTFLRDEGRNLLDAWCNTGQSPPLELESITVEVVAGPGGPGEASPQGDGGAHLRASWDAAGSEIDVTYAPACNATDHTIYWGPLSGVSHHEYHEAKCGLGVSGTAAFTPPEGDVFFLVVGNDGSQEGSYGVDSSAVPRLEAVGTPLCDLPRAFAATCSP
jgi:hypothetical protein